MTDEGEHAQNIRAAEREHDLTNDIGKRLLDASLRAAQEAIKIAFLINGGAAVAILAFIAGLASRSGISFVEIKPVTRSLYWFAAGVVLAGIISACAYLANGLVSASYFSKDKIWTSPYVADNEISNRKRAWGNRFLWWGFWLAWVALGTFINRHLCGRAGYR
jgi:hypothetical protein